MEKEKKMDKKKLSIIVGIMIILIDQLTKFILINKNIIVIPNFLEFNYIENQGVAFSIADGNIVMIVLLNIIILGTIIKFLKERNEQIDYKIVMLLSFILAGGISNLIDRIFRGYVIDFISVNLFDFPTFNIADTIICIAVVLLIIYILKTLSEDRKTEMIHTHIKGKQH